MVGPIRAGRKSLLRPSRHDRIRCPANDYTPRVMRPASMWRTMPSSGRRCYFAPIDLIRKGRNVENINERKPWSLFEAFPIIGTRSRRIPGFRWHLECGHSRPRPGRSALRAHRLTDCAIV